MTGFLKLVSANGDTCVVNLSHVKYYKLMRNKITFIMTTSGTISTVIDQQFETEDLAREYYNKLTEYLEITI